MYFDGISASGSIVLCTTTGYLLPGQSFCVLRRDICFRVNRFVYYDGIPASVVHKPIANVCLIFLVFFLSFFFLVFFFMVEQKGQKTTHSCGRDMRWFDNVSKYVLGD